MSTPTTPPPQQGGQEGQPGDGDRPTGQELARRVEELNEEIRKHLGRRAK